MSRARTSSPLVASIALLATALLVTAAVTPARADQCNGIDAGGHCVNATTLEWCDEGTLVSVTCPLGEICAHYEGFNGGYLCLKKTETPCADIPPEGRCSS